MRIVRAVLILGRIGLGLLGCTMVLESVVGLFAPFDGAPWWIVCYAIVNGFIGYCLAYGAFHHFPWERFPSIDAPAA
jgi:hypothetical protein